jgi:diacylglycerol O-acyltransferase
LESVEPFDYLMLRGESDPRMRAALLSVSLLDRSPGIEDLRTAFDRASRLVPRLRQRVVAPAAPVTSAVWVVDADFDLGYHVRSIRAPGTGSLRDVLDFAQTSMSAPLDIARPLWEATLVEGVDAPGASAALVLKVNHTLTDGEGAVQLLLSLLDFERDADRGPMPLLPIPEERSSIGLVRTAVRAAPKRSISAALRVVQAAPGRLVGSLRDPIGTIRHGMAMVGSVRRVLGSPPAPPSPLLRRRGVGRRLEVLTVPLEGLRAAGKAAGGTVNDAYLAGVSGGLRRYHAHLGVPVDGLPLAMPVSVRTDEDAPGGNLFSEVRVAAPVGIADPVARMQDLRGQVLDGGAEPALDVLSMVGPVVSHLPLPLLSQVATAASSMDVLASNVRGFEQPPYVAGAELTESYWFGPLPGVAMMVVLFSQAGTCFVGVHLDTAAVSDPQLLVRCLGEGFDEVVAAGNVPKRTRRRSTG